MFKIINVFFERQGEREREKERKREQIFRWKRKRELLSENSFKFGSLLVLEINCIFCFIINIRRKIVKLVK